MGESHYYLRAEFRDAETAAAAGLQFRELLDDLLVLNEDWQAIRGQQHRVPAERLEEIKQAHPLAAELIAGLQIKADEDSMNVLAGPLPNLSGAYELEGGGTELLLDDEVWHCTDWGPLVDWLLRHGAVGAGFVNEEWLEIDPWSHIEMRVLVSAPSSAEASA